MYRAQVQANNTRGRQKSRKTEKLKLKRPKLKSRSYEKDNNKRFWGPQPVGNQPPQHPPSKNSFVSPLLWLIRPLLFPTTQLNLPLSADEKLVGLLNKWERKGDIEGVWRCWGSGRGKARGGGACAPTKNQGCQGIPKKKKRIKSKKCLRNTQKL